MFTLNHGQVGHLMDEQGMNILIIGINTTLTKWLRITSTYTHNIKAYREYSISICI